MSRALFWPRLALRFWLLVGLLVLLVVGSSSAAPSVHAAPASTENLAPGVAPGSPSVLVINQGLPKAPQDSERYGADIEMLLRHFTPNTTRISPDQYTQGQLSDFDRVVVIGNDDATPLPSALLNDLAQTDRPILWLGYGLDRLPVNMASTYGFSATPVNVTSDELPNSVEYKGQDYQAKVDDYTRINIDSPSVQVLATYNGTNVSVPYIVHSKNLWYVNGVPEGNYADYPVPEDAPALIFADALHDFFGTSITDSRKAVIRLEDVSVHINPDRIYALVDYLYSQHVPFALGLIPAQRFADGSIVGLGERPEFVRAIRYAQDHGATIVLHGYHHTFGTGEDYEFWDAERNAPLAGETWDAYAYKVEDGIRILRNYGIEPRMWETPHYAGSTLAYQVFSHYFSYAFENRDPAGWLPYPSGPDQYGQMLLPEQLGYIDPAAPAEGMTVDDQLQRAKLLQIVRDGWAAGFVHPAVLSPKDIEPLVEGLRQQGYTFADLRTLPTEVHSDYQPDEPNRLINGLWIELGGRGAWLVRKLGWPLLVGLSMGVIWLIALPRLVSRARMLEPYETSPKIGFLERIHTKVRKITHRRDKYRL